VKQFQSANLLKMDNCRENPVEPLRHLYIKVLIAERGSDRVSSPLQLELKQWLLIPLTACVTHEMSPSVALTSVVVRGSFPHPLFIVSASFSYHPEQDTGLPSSMEVSDFANLSI